MQGKEYRELGRLVIDFPIEYSTILDLRIEENANEHGTMWIKVMASNIMLQSDVSRLEGMKIAVRTAEGEILFSGLCQSVELQNQSGYGEMIIRAASHSMETDVKKNSRTFQKTDKMLSEVANTVMEAYGILVEISEDTVIEMMLNQSKETDWAFLKRIGNQFGYLIFVDSHLDNLRISLGKGEFSISDAMESVDLERRGKNIEEFLKLQANLDPEVSSYDFEAESSKISSLILGAGHMAGGKPVTSNVIRVEGGMLVNEVTSKPQGGIMPKMSQAAEKVMSSNVVTGTVLAVEGVLIKVHFNVDGSQAEGEARWIPYEHAVNNYLYSMPDVGDTVFIYYENQGKKAVCLGSRRSNGDTHPDFNHPEHKMLTSCNKMIKFTPDTVELVENRKEYDQDELSPTAIRFDKSGAMLINSTKSIVIKGAKGVLIQASEGELDPSKAIKGFEQKHDAGKLKYTTSGGMSSKQQEEAQAKKIVADSNKEIKDNFVNGIKGMNPLKIIGTVGALVDPFLTTLERQPEEEEKFENGVIDILSMKNVQLVVGKSSILIQNEAIQIKTPLYRHLGTEKGTHEIKSDKHTSWFDTFLDVAQFGLDIVGCIPGVGVVANVVNAGISVARGDYVGALASVVSCVPFAGPVVGKGMKLVKAGAAMAKVASKVAKIGSKLTKVLKFVDKARKIMGVVSNIDTVLFSISEWMAMARDPNFSWSDPGCISRVVKSLGAVKLTAGKGIKKGQKSRSANAKNPNTRKTNGKSKDKRKEKRQEQRKANQARKKRPLKCAKDPINVITGSLMTFNYDLTLRDLQEPFSLKRTYESVYTNEGRMLGSKWIFNVESNITFQDSSAEALMPDLHLEQFEKIDGCWENEREDDQAYQLVDYDGGYLLKSVKEAVSYEYDNDGNLMAVTDTNHNRTSYLYEGNTLVRIELPSSQFMDFEYENQKVVRVTDTIGRKISYQYEGEYLTAVTCVDGGIIRYEYTEKGYIRSITDQNGKKYVTNTYDDRGRVVRQELSSGQEYTILYNDADRVNTFFTASNGEQKAYAYNKEGLLVKEIYGDGTYEEIRYDKWENEIYNRSRSGAESHRKFSEKGLLLEETEPSDLTTWYTYDEKDHLVRIWDHTGGEGDFTYDNQGNLLTESIRIDSGAVIQCETRYDAKGRKIRRVDGNGNVTAYEYHTLFDGPSLMITAEEERFYYTYDESGRMMSMSDGEDTVTYAYNNYNLKTMVTDAAGNTTKYVYDKLSNLVKKIRPEGYQEKTFDGKGIEYTYDHMDSLLTTKDEAGNIFALIRNLEGNIIKEIHPNVYDPKSRDGLGVESVYDDEERKVKVIYPDGGVVRLKYDAEGRIIKRIEPEEYCEKTDDGKGYCYRYDLAGRLEEIINPLGVAEKRYVYDAHGHILKEVDAIGIASATEDEEQIGTLYAYNLLGWLTERREAVSLEGREAKYQLTAYKYDKEGNLIEEKRYLDYQGKTGASGRVHRIFYEYDRRNRLIKVRDTSRAAVEYKYNAYNQKIKEKKRIGEETNQVVNYRYNEAGKLVEVSETADKKNTGKTFATTKMFYDKNGNLIRIVTPLGHEIRREYDLTDRMLTESHVEKGGSIHNTTSFVYDKAGNITVVRDQNGHEVRYGYDLFDREISAVGKNGGITRKEYNKNGRLEKLVLPNEEKQLGPEAQGYQYRYDLLGRVEEILAPTGAVIQKNRYDSSGKLMEQVDGTGSGAEYFYDFAGRREKVLTKGGSRQVYEYDARGNIIGVEDGNANRTHFELDEWGRITGIKKADGSYESYRYDYAGNVIEAVDGEEHAIGYTYNGANLLEEICYQTGEKERFAYDLEGNVKEQHNRNGTVIQLQENMYGNLVYKRDKESGLEESFQYSADGSLKAAIAQGMRYDYAYYPNGSLKEKSASGKTLLQYEYDLNGNKAKQTDLTGKTTEYRYNMLDLLEEVYDNDRKQASYWYDAVGNLAGMKAGKDLETIYGFDLDQNITKLETHLAGTSLVSNEYQYDGNGNQTSKKQLHGTTFYHYDAVNQLVKAAYPTHVEELFYDKVGNRTRRVAPDMEESYQYDACNRLRAWTKSGVDGRENHDFFYDRQGNLLKDDRAEYTYNAFRQMVSVKTFDGETQVNHYDAEGLRHEVEENGRLVKFLYSGSEVVLEENTDDRIRYVRGYEIISSDSEKARTYYHYASDEMGSMTHLIEDGGKMLNRYEYDAFGNALVCEETVANRFRYAGQQYDPISRQYYLRARFYNPVVGRFTQEDEYHGDGLNLYAYCKNNPIGYFDPSGYEVCAKKSADQYKTEKDAKGKRKYTDAQGDAADKAYSRRKNQGKSEAEARASAENAAKKAAEFPNSQGGPEVIWPSKPHKNGTEGHWETILDEVEEMKKSKRYSKIYVNKGLGNEIQGAKPNRRPDVMGVKKNGRIDQVEVPSKTDDVVVLIDRMKDNQRILGDRAGGIKVRPIKK